MLGKSLANSRPGLGRSLRAPGLVVSLTLRDELQKQQGLTLPLVCADVLKDSGGFPVLSDDNGTLPLFGPRDELRCRALERGNGLNVLRGVHDTIFSTQLGARHVPQRFSEEELRSR